MSLPLAQQALQEAQRALQRGEKRAARRWAERALAQDAGLEEAWLVLAAVSTPRASLEYLQRALQINPQSERARRGLEWARQRLEALPPASPPPTPARTARTLLPGWLTGCAVAGRLAVGSFLLLALVLAFPLARSLTPQRASAPTQGAEMTSVPDLPASSPTPFPQAAVSARFPVPPALEDSSPSRADPPAPSPTPLPTDTPEPAFAVAPTPDFQSGKLILVDISEQRMYVYENGTLIYNFVVSTGMNGGTRVGTFSVLNKIPNAYGSTWDIWMPNWLGIYWSGHLQNGIHALPILPNGQRLWAGYLGTPVSYGCVVLGTYESQLLYDWAEVGTPVVIQY